MAQYQPWEIVDLTMSTMEAYPHVDVTKINRELTAKLRKCFHDVAMMMEHFKEKEHDYLDFLAQRACFHPRCLFIPHHEKEVKADYIHLCQLKARLIQLRDNILVQGGQRNLADITILDCFLPGGDTPLDTSELHLAIYGINKQ